MWNHISGGVEHCPMVLNLTDAGRRPGSGQQHGHAGEECIYANMAGLKVVVPHKVYDIKGLMHAAIRDGGPVAFFTNSGEASADIPDEPFVVPIGKAQILQEGTDITIASIPPANLEVEKALPDLAKAGISVEYFDPRTLKPFDEDTLVNSVTKTKRLLVVSHGQYTNDFSSHMIAVAAQAVSGAKFYKITFPDAPCPGSGPMVDWMIPDAPKIIDAAQKLIG
jgi:pyruvate/2-oxoglutarate/acetoin dehydrogenase E1 component